MNVMKITPLGVIAGAVAMIAAVVAAAIVEGSPLVDAVANTSMSTGVTVTAVTPPRTPVVFATPSIKGPAPLPPEEQGLPGS